MAWFGPAGNCGCCECIAADGPYARFQNTPTIRIVITGLPSSYDFRHFESPFPSIVNLRREFDLVGMDSANGTYFWGLNKNANGCIIPSPGYSDSYFTNDNGINKTYTRPGCSQTDSSSIALTPFIFISGTTADGPKYTITVTMSRAQQYNIRGEIELTPVTSYTAAVGDNTVAIGATAFSATWPKSSGDIKIIRRALSADFCDLPFENANGFVFETIGHVSAEIIDI